MKNMKRMKSLLLAAMMIFSVLLMAACDGGEEQSGTADYQVTVLDAQGQPYSEGVIVRFLKDGEQVAMQKAGEDGVASRTLDKGEYTVELMFTDNDVAYYYDKNNVTLTAEKTQLQIVLTYAASGEGRMLWVNEKDYKAYDVVAGITHVDLTAGDRSYFLFTPDVAGTYRFSVQGEGVQIGYYGAPHFVQSINAAEVVDNAFTVSVSASMIGTGDTGTTVMVIGIDSENAVEALLTIERTGDPKETIEDKPWTIYKETIELKAYTMPAGAEVSEFDLTAAGYALVLDEATGYYHLNSADGPLVLVRLGAVSGGSAYLPAFETILENSGVVKYFYDENGNFVKKESYSECLLEYIKYMDADTGMYPLTEDLKYIIQQRGDHYGWFDAASSSYLFIDSNTGAMVPGINSEISWLFMCCYMSET